MHLFAYGTLIFPEIWQRVVVREFEKKPATLKGFVAYRIIGDLFPVLIPGSASNETAGIVYFDLDEQTIEQLDAHESTLYEREEVTAVLDDGRAVRCQAYILAARNRRFASDTRWTPDWFQREAMPTYIANHWPS
jgi:gamma-glutamylcyclotransferase (GGCT)/AIG2-like uncharacterized protein YtfP